MVELSEIFLFYGERRLTEEPNYENFHRLIKIHLSSWSHFVNHFLIRSTRPNFVGQFLQTFWLVKCDLVLTHFVKCQLPSESFVRFWPFFCSNELMIHLWLLTSELKFSLFMWSVSFHWDARSVFLDWEIGDFNYNMAEPSSSTKVSCCGLTPKSLGP